MGKIKLDYNAINVAEAEDRSNKSFFDVFAKLQAGQVGISEIVFLLRAGGANDEQVKESVAESLSEDSDGIAIVDDIFEALGSSGFLGKKLDRETLSEMKRVANASKAPKSSKTSSDSETTGEA